MPESKRSREYPPENHTRALLKALESSGVLKDADRVSEADGTRRFLEEASRQGLAISPEYRVSCDGDHYFFIIPR